MKKEEIEEIRKIIFDSFLLVSVVGVHGGNLHNIYKYELSDNNGLLINSSRAIVYASHSGHFAQIPRIQAKERYIEICVILDKIL